MDYKYWEAILKGDARELELFMPEKKKRDRRLYKAVHGANLAMNGVPSGIEYEEHYRNLEDVINEFGFGDNTEEDDIWRELDAIRAYFRNNNSYGTTSYRYDIMLILDEKRLPF